VIIAVIVISLVIGFVVAAGVVGVQAQRLGRQRREPVWRLAEAAEFVAQLVPFDIAAGLRADELEALLRAHLNQLQFGSDAAPDDTEEAGDDSGPTVTEDRSSGADLYRDVRRAGVEVTLEQVQAVVDAHLEYLRRIGALAAVDPGGRM